MAAQLATACTQDTATPLPGAPPHHVEGGFRNDPQIGDAPLHAFLYDRLRLALLPNPEAVPRPPVLSSAAARRAWDALGDADAVLWVGHSTVLVRLGGKTILTDPVFADYVTPVPPIGPRRLVPPGIALADLPHIDAIVVSHDHYDHFEPDGIRRIAARDRPLCLLPLRVGTGDYGCGRTLRLDWGQSAALGKLRLRFLPAQHDSGRGLFDQKASLWGSWLIEAGRRRVYFAGDTGYGPHFAAIGRKYGPIALALLPVAAYRPRIVNRYVHLDPPEALRAFGDLRAARMLAIHWGTFVLGDDGVEAARADVPRAAAAAQVGADRVWVLEIGEARRF
ncbi:MAG: MBL fold metallo-hydrolase [Rhodospirillaceae bacterium]|nr:MBL fold metallo-hydrolase [Rhodospirillaceae bacterium]